MFSDAPGQILGCGFYKAADQYWSPRRCGTVLATVHPRLAAAHRREIVRQLVRLTPTARAATSDYMRHTCPVSCIDPMANNRGVGQTLQMYFLLLLNARLPN